MKASDWLNQQFLKWKQGRGRRATVTEFARHLGITQQSLSSYMSGAYQPRGANLGKIAAHKLANQYVSSSIESVWKMNSKYRYLIGFIGDVDPSFRIR